MLFSVEQGALDRGSEAEAHRGRLGGPALAALVLAVGFIATFLVVAGLRANQRDNAKQVMDQRTAVALAAVQTETERYRALLETTAAGISTDPHFTWDDFDQSTAPLASSGLAGAVTVGYVVPAQAAAIPATQRLWRGRGAEGLVLRPAEVPGEHFFSIFSRPLNSAVSSPAGGDVAGSREATDALTDARRLGQPTVSDTYVLLRDRNLPRTEQQHSFVFVAPIWTRAPIPVFRGWIVLGMRSQDFLGGVLRTVSQGQLDGTLLATNRDGSHAVVARFTVRGRTDLERINNFPVADQQWTLITQADPSRLPGAHSTLAPTVLAGGLAITLILAGLVHVLATGRTRAWQQVLAATAELRGAERESRRQAGLLGAIMTSIGDGVAVVDEDGAFLLLNPAAKQLTGVTEEVDDPAAWQAHFGIYRPDGRTPYPVDELPVMRSLRGESCDGVELVIRNPQRPEGILLSVDGRPLDPSAGQRGAVAVFRDITELRRYESDLAVFAGVVAHDLKAPLAVVRGHCEAATDDLAAAPDAEPVRAAGAALVRVVLAVDRMAGLIDTLLAYSTARDAPLRTGDVALGPLVAEVVQERIAHLPPDGRPDVYVGPLPPVRADPAMLRHVLDNLIGNALKYVRPGALARVDVTATRVPGDRVQVEIADRGIGIPDADKPEVFDTFHRSTAAAGYAGTGLGLAICKRIVQRHGGVIGVVDNPGGGTRFYFTIPSTAPVQGTPPAEESPAMPETTPPADDAAVRAALERALAERAEMENSRLPGLAEPPTPGDTPTHRESVPEHRRGA